MEIKHSGCISVPPRDGSCRFVVVDSGREKKEVTDGERENEKVSGSVHRLWSLGLVYLQYLHRRSLLALISAAPRYSSY